jgi:formimidoylglutamate deiminase
MSSRGKRPIEWLLDHVAIDARWCVVHATHMTPDETQRLAGSGAVAGLAPTTEADLGDGIFDACAFVEQRGTIAIGSDSNTCIDPFAELRQLEWSQRLARQQRNVLVANDRVPVGQSLYAMAAEGGARALRQPVGAIEPGQRADLVVLDNTDPALIGQSINDVIDAAIFGPSRHAVRDVMVAGQWVVRDHRHARRDSVLQNYRATLARLAPR